MYSLLKENALKIRPPAEPGLCGISPEHKEAPPIREIILLPMRDCLSPRVGEFFRSLQEEARREFESIVSLSSPAAHTRLFAEHQEPSNLYISWDGQVKLFTRSSEGRRLILRIAEPGEILGLSSAFTGSPYQMTAETLHVCTVASVQRPEFLEFLNRHPAAYRDVAYELSLRQDQACARLRTIGLTHSTSAKLGRLLLEWSANGMTKDAGVGIPLILTHAEIAECIATSRETVTRILSDFRRRGIVQMHGETLTVIDRAALETCSDMW
jgi:CRP/FNR family transcriptional regulator